jgi:hypothetical protein
MGIGNMDQAYGKEEKVVVAAVVDAVDAIERAGRPQEWNADLEDYKEHLEGRRWSRPTRRRGRRSGRQRRRR